MTRGKAQNSSAVIVRWVRTKPPRVSVQVEGSMRGTPPIWSTGQWIVCLCPGGMRTGRNVSGL